MPIIGLVRPKNCPQKCPSCLTTICWLSTGKIGFFTDLWQRMKKSNFFNITKNPPKLTENLGKLLLAGYKRILSISFVLSGSWLSSEKIEYFHLFSYKRLWKLKIESQNPAIFSDVEIYFLLYSSWGHEIDPEKLSCPLWKNLLRKCQVWHPWSWLGESQISPNIEVTVHVLKTCFLG